MLSQINFRLGPVAAIKTQARFKQNPFAVEMGWFTHRSKSPTPLATAIAGSRPANVNSASKVVVHEQDPGDSADPEKDDAEKDENKETKEEEKTKFAKKNGVGSGALKENEEVTELNTNHNAMLYHFSEESVDLYKSENNSLDLMGRIYYDDYDANDPVVAERVASFTSLASLGRASPMPLSIDHTLSPELTPFTSHGHPIYPCNSAFERQVSFDTLSDDHHSAITLKVKHPEFKFRRNNKTILVGFSNDPESLKAVEWAFLELLIHGDTLIVLHVLDEKTYKRVDPPLADLVLEKLKKLNTHDRRISLVYEIVIGNPQKLLKKAITEFKPAMMIVGTHQYGQAPMVPTESSVDLLNMNHHRHHPVTPPLQPHKLSSGFLHHGHKSLFSKATTSEYFLQYALVPVIVVKPFYEIRETLKIPVDSERYFQDWLANIDISHTREKKKKHRFGISSPTLSRNSSSTNLNDLHPLESRGRTKDGLFLVNSRDLSRSSSRSRSVSRSRANDELSPVASLRQRLSRLLSH